MQKLSPAARRAKLARDLAYANTREREIKRADNQRYRRAAIKAGNNISNKDYDHTTGKFVSIKTNRGGHGKGTKK